MKSRIDDIAAALFTATLFIATASLLVSVLAGSF